jgi:hypothetical protein
MCVCLPHAGIPPNLEPQWWSQVSEKNMSFLIREHQRKYQIGCSHCMVFRRKNDVRSVMA